MKKTLYLLGILGILVAPFISSAAVSELPEGCKADYRFSPLTGKPCSTIPDCAIGDLFSTLTGRRCDGTSKILDLQNEVNQLKEQINNQKKTILPRVASPEEIQRSKEKSITDEYTRKASTLDQQISNLLNEKPQNWEQKLLELKAQKQQLDNEYYFQTQTFSCVNRTACA